MRRSAHRKIFGERTASLLQVRLLGSEREIHGRVPPRPTMRDACQWIKRFRPPCGCNGSSHRREPRQGFAAQTDTLGEERPSPSATAVTYWDTNLAGSGVRVSPKGCKNFIAQYRVKGGPEVVDFALIPMPVNQPFVLPNLKAGIHKRQYVELMRSLDGCRVIVMLDVMRCADVVAVVKEIDAI